MKTCSFACSHSIINSIKCNKVHITWEADHGGRTVRLPPNSYYPQTDDSVMLFFLASVIFTKSTAYTQRSQG